MRWTVRVIRKHLALPLARLAVRVCGTTAIQQAAFSVCDYPGIKRQYGDFRLDQCYDHRHITGLSKESGSIRGAIVDVIERTDRRISRALLPGEYNTDKPQYARLFDVEEKQIVTAGMGEDMDHEWDYEQDPPEMGKFDLIISQAMLEHLLDPHKHVVDLSRLLNTGGLMILHTHIPGFSYHRYPVDCLRFYPDWFEELAKRLHLSVVDRYIGDLRICYTLQNRAI